MHWDARLPIAGYYRSVEASKRGSVASADTPERALRQGKLPPSPIDALRPPDPPQQPDFFSCDGVKGGDSIASSPARA